MPAFGEITANVDFNQLTNLAAGNILYIDTTTITPTVQIAADETAFKETSETCLAIGAIGLDEQGGSYYEIYTDAVKQIVNTS